MGYMRGNIVIVKLAVTARSYAGTHLPINVLRVLSNASRNLRDWVLPWGLYYLNRPNFTLRRLQTISSKTWPVFRVNF